MSQIRSVKYVYHNREEKVEAFSTHLLIVAPDCFRKGQAALTVKKVCPTVQPSPGPGSCLFGVDLKNESTVFCLVSNLALPIPPRVFLSPWR